MDQRARRDIEGSRVQNAGATFRSRTVVGKFAVVVRNRAVDDAQRTGVVNPSAADGDVGGNGAVSDGHGAGVVDPSPRKHRLCANCPK